MFFRPSSNHGRQRCAHAFILYEICFFFLLRKSFLAGVYWYLYWPWAGLDCPLDFMAKQMVDVLWPSTDLHLQCIVFLNPVLLSIEISIAHLDYSASNIAHLDYSASEVCSSAMDPGDQLRTFRLILSKGDWKRFRGIERDFDWSGI